jgi:type I restriction enzyme R subunit
MAPFPVIVIVRDMWQTGFDAPCLHTMYADKPMRGQGLMQAIARVNRVFREKPGGLIVDYLGLADQLRNAVGTYTASGGTGSPSYDVAQAIAIMLEKYEVACDILHGFDRTLRETARAKIRVIVKRILNKWGYPPDQQEEAVKTVLQQAELLCADWSDGIA